MNDFPHPWRMLEDGRIALAFPMPESPVFVATVLERNRRDVGRDVNAAVLEHNRRKVATGGPSSHQIALAGLRRRKA